MAKIREREIAWRLRKKGNSIADIAEHLSVSKSTVSSWCRDIPLSELAIEKIAQKSKAKSTSALLAYSERCRERRIRNIHDAAVKGAQTLGNLKTRDIYCIGLGLYWGEGYKKGTQEFGFTNGDPAIILFYIVWLRSVFGITNDELIFRVSINDQHRHRQKEVERYWSRMTGVPRKQFTKTSFIKTTAKKNYKNHREHFGTLRIKVRRGTNGRREILGALEAAGDFAQKKMR